MQTKEFGSDNSRVMLFLHGGNDKAFTGIENSAEEIIRYIDRNFGGKILLIGGLSLGAQILPEILSKRSDICRFAVIERTLAFPLKGENAYIRPAVKMSYGLISKRWFSKLQAASLHIPEEFFEDYYRDSCAVSIDDLISVLEANTAYRLKDGLKNSQAKALILFGGRERGAIKSSAGLIEQAVPRSSSEMLCGLYHGEFSLGRPHEYVKRVEMLISEKCSSFCAL